MKFRFSNGFEYSIANGKTTEYVVVINFETKTLDTKRTAAKLINALTREALRSQFGLIPEVDQYEKVLELAAHVKMGMLEDFEVEITEYNLEIRPQDHFIYYYINSHLVACSTLNVPHEYSRRLKAPNEISLKRTLLRSMKNLAAL